MVMIMERKEERFPVPLATMVCITIINIYSISWIISL